MGADARNLPALVNINWFASMDVNNEARSLVTTQQLVFSGGRSWTGFTRLVPSFSHVVGTAAHLLGHVEGQLVLTRVVEVAVAHALSHVHAVVSSIDLHVLRRTHTSVVAQSVVAGAGPADPSVSRALIDIFADASLFIEVVPWWTLTLETAKCVDTVSTLAEAWKLLALVNILQDDRDGVGSEPFSSRTQSLIVGGVEQGAHFTGVSPGDPL